MKVAMTYLDGNIFQHFGRSEYFVIYTIESGNIIEKELVQISGHGHGSRATLLKELGVDALICGGYGPSCQSGNG